jgi:hypothetical protein
MKEPTIVDGKMTVDRDPDEISWYAADITQELIDRATAPDPSKLALDLVGVAQLQGPSLQTATAGGVMRTYVVVLLGPADGAMPADAHWTARVACMNGERFDKTTWFKKVDT